MGHCEMLLAVAGLDEDEVADRTKQLASGDWSGFSAADRVAFAFARKQAKEPWSITGEDYQELVDHFGPHRTVDVVWWERTLGDPERCSRRSPSQIPEGTVEGIVDEGLQDRDTGIFQEAVNLPRHHGVGRCPGVVRSRG